MSRTGLDETRSFWIVDARVGAGIEMVMVVVVLDCSGWRWRRVARAHVEMDIYLGSCIADGMT